MRRVPVNNNSYKIFGEVTLIMGLIVVMVIYPFLDFVEEDRRETKEYDEQHNYLGTAHWTQEKEIGFILLAVAMAVGQLMAFIGFGLIVMSAVKSYMSAKLPPKLIQCDNCQTWFDMKWLWCPKCDKPVTEAMYLDNSRPHVIKVAIAAIEDNEMQNNSL